MRLLRSWPKTIPAGRAYVHDEVERLVMDDFDYRLLGDVGDDILLVEWDVAVGMEDLQRFGDACLVSPDQVRVAPYRLHQEQSGPLHAPLWAHRRYGGSDPRAPSSTRFVTEDDATTHLFGFGLVYLPRDVVVGFMSAWPGPVDDTSFSSWHYFHAADPEVPIEWGVRPVHLHYPIGGVSWTTT